MSSTYKQITATTQIKFDAGKIKGLFISNAASTPEITVYDSATANASDPTLIDTFTPVSASSHFFYDGIYASKGIYVVISGTVSVTVAYE